MYHVPLVEELPNIIHSIIASSINATFVKPGFSSVAVPIVHHQITISPKRLLDLQGYVRVLNVKRLILLSVVINVKGQSILRILMYLKQDKKTALNAKLNLSFIIVKHVKISIPSTLNALTINARHLKR